MRSISQWVLVLAMAAWPGVLWAQTPEATPAVAGQGTLHIQVDGLRSDQGKVRISLFSSADGFPGQTAKAIQLVEAEIRSKTAVAEITGVAFGSYALALIHDENNNGRMDGNFIGMPTEGVGTSNNPKPLFGPPSYQDAEFQHQSSMTELTITMRYLF